MDQQKLNEVLSWVETQIQKYPYSEISIKFCIHDGKVKRLDRGINEKIIDIQS